MYCLRVCFCSSFLPRNTKASRSKSPNLARSANYWSPLVGRHRQKKPPKPLLTARGSLSVCRLHRRTMSGCKSFDRGLRDGCASFCGRFLFCEWRDFAIVSKKNTKNTNANANTINRTRAEICCKELCPTEVNFSVVISFPFLFRRRSFFYFLKCGLTAPTGSIATEIALLSKLTYLSMTVNNVTNTIPSQLGLLTELQYL